MSARDDEQHLRALSIAHYVVAAFQALFGCVPLIYVGIGLFIIYNPPKGNPIDPPPEVIGTIFAAVGALMALMTWVMAACILFAGLSIDARRRHTFCMVVGAICCLFFPIGTTLGVFTLIVLARPSVKELFQHRSIEAVSLNGAVSVDDAVITDETAEPMLDEQSGDQA